MRESVRQASRNFDEMWRQMEKFAENAAGQRKMPVVFTRPSWQPNVDICENAECVVVLAELAGVKRDELNIAVDSLVMTISGVRHDLMRGRKQRVYVMEINFGQFERLVPLPAAVDAEAASATYEDGFLQIVLPKAREPRPRRIEIVTT
jgi:HSP20 family protein